MPSSSVGLLVSCILLSMMETKEALNHTEELGNLAGGSWIQVDAIVGQVVERHLAGCHLVLATTKTDHATIFPSILRRLAAGGQASKVVDVVSLFSLEESTRDLLQQGLWHDTRTTCRSLILCVGAAIDDLTIKFLEASPLWLQPDTTTVVVGGRAALKTIVHHAGLRNTIRVVLLALDVAPPISPVETLLRKGTLAIGGSGRVKAYRRRLYCRNGGMGVQQLLHQSPTSSDIIQWDGIFPEGRAQDLMGHTIRVVTLDAVPFIAYRKVSEDPSDPVRPLDSFDVRILNIIAAQLNFTYEMREPWDGTWGVPLSGGNWSGIVGTLQHEEADFSLNLTPSPARMEVITYSIIYSRDPLQIASLKPGPLPRHLALIRPFTDLVWMMVVVSTTASGVALWLLQKAWSWASGWRSTRLDSALFDSWSALLQESTTEVPANISGQLFVGWWWMTCVVIGTAYTSSLIAHLSVQSKFPPIDTFRDLLEREGWSWGIHALHGTTFLYFNQSTDPVTQGVYQNLKTYSFKDGFERVLSGGFSYITFKFYIRVRTAGYRDKYGLTPFYLSATEYPVFGGNSWGFRKGAPFLGDVRMIKQRLIDAGLVDYLTNDAIEKYIRNVRAKRDRAEVVHSEVEDGQVVLGLDHLQGVFYLLLLGYVIALATFLAEELTCQRIPK